MEGNDQYPTIQIVNIRIDSRKFIEGDDYCFKKLNEIKRKINKQANKKLINFMLSEPINEAWAIDTLLDYQSMFTDIIIMPPTNLPKEKFEKWSIIRNPTQILRSI